MGRQGNLTECFDQLAAAPGQPDQDGGVIRVNIPLVSPYGEIIETTLVLEHSVPYKLETITVTINALHTKTHAAGSIIASSVI